MTNKAKLSTVSPSQVVFRSFPDACRNLPHGIVRVSTVTHPEEDLKGARARHVREVVAERITEEARRVKLHRREAQRRRQARRDMKKAPDAEGTGDDTILDEIFGNLTDEDAHEESRAAGEEEMQPIRARSISFIQVDEQSVVRTRVFPRTFHCKACGHFIAIDPARPPARMRCPCCGNERLLQEPIIFMCARCANVRELAPKAERIPEESSGPARRRRDTKRKPRSVHDFLGGPPPCPDCQDGHIHLLKHDNNSVQQWEWRCSSCRRYQEGIQEICFDCLIPRGPARGSGNRDDAGAAARSDFIFMNAFPASASNSLRPLIEVQMFIHDEPLDPRSLPTSAREMAKRWPDYFELRGGVGSTLSTEEVQQVASTGISNAYLLDHLGVITTVYGYRAGSVANHPQSPVGEEDRLARFFSDPEGFAEYVCYGMLNEGAALVIELDKELIDQRLGLRGATKVGTVYDALVEQDRNALASMQVKDILQLSPDSPRAALFRALHGMEHALLSSAIRRIGSDVLGSKLFLSAGIILIYEREKVGRGGVVQLVNKGKGLLALLTSAADHVAGCAQGCSDGCPACTYVRDTFCQYEYADLGRSWLPANALLSRSRARRLLASELPV
jgi:rubrerythrin